jgi:hypothetical protein
MKNYLIIAASALVLQSCNQGEIDKSRAELKESNKENDSLKVLASEHETSINDFMSYFNDVERNLDSVTMKQNIIQLNSDKEIALKRNQKERINEEINGINNLMDVNRKMIAELNKKLSGSGFRNSQLKKTIVLLNDQLILKDQELTDLNVRLEALNAQVVQLQTSVDTLHIQNAEQSKNISEKTMALHTAYYVIGKSKELEESRIIDKKGGLLGIGRTSKLNEDFDKSKFTRIDYTQSDRIAINSDDMKIITTHPSDSYTLDMDTKDKDLVKNLIITNPEKFWSASKYLVIIKG